MNIVFTGCHGTGKTTLLEELRKRDEFKHYEYSTGVTRKLAAAGEKINKDGDDETQQKLIDIHSKMLMDVRVKRNRGEKVYRIADRSVIDIHVYTKYLYDKGKLSKEVLDNSIHALEKHMKDIDVVFYLKPEFDIVDDGVRDIDEKFKDDITALFDDIIDEFDIPVIILTGSVENRVDAIYEVIFNDFSDSDSKKFNETIK